MKIKYLHFKYAPYLVKVTAVDNNDGFKFYFIIVYYL